MYASGFKAWSWSGIILTENLSSYTSLDRLFVFRQFDPHGLPRADPSIAFCFRGDNDSLLLGMGLHFLSPSSSILPTPLPFRPSRHLPPIPPPLVSQPLLVLPPRWRCSIALSQRKRGMRDKSKPPYFPSVPLTVPDWIWGFSSHFSSFSFPCLPWRPLKITWNQAVSQLNDAVSFMHVEGDSRQASLFILWTHLKSSASVVCSKNGQYQKSNKGACLPSPMSYESSYISKLV